MTEADWQGCDDIWTIMRWISAAGSPDAHRRLACEFARLVWKELPPIGQSALIEAEKLANGESDEETCEHYQRQLQEVLSEENESEPISTVIWALQQHSSSYPTWYSASLVGSNIIELEAAGGAELCQIVRRAFSYETAKSSQDEKDITSRG